MATYMMRTDDGVNREYRRASKEEKERILKGYERRGIRIEFHKDAQGRRTFTTKRRE